jgi:hypothetical protein
MVVAIIKTYTMKEQLEFSKLCSLKITEYLHKNTKYRVVNVEDEPIFKEGDVDLLLVDIKDIENLTIHRVEVKGDRQEETGNYFIEIISNSNKNTKGCMLYTKSDYIFYYFSNINQLHIINTKELQNWLNTNINKFKEVATSTSSNNKDRIFYKTYGRLIPKDIIKNEVGVKIYNIN